MTEPILPDRPILETIKSLIPSADEIARSLQVEHDDAERIHRLMIIRHAELLGLLDDAGQAVTDLIGLAKQADQVVTDAVDLAQQASQAVTDSVERAEGASQAVLTSTDLIDTQADLIASQKGHKRRMVKFADKQADAQQIAKTTDVLFSGDPLSIRHVFEIIDLARTTEAATPMDEGRVFDIIDALMRAHPASLRHVLETVNLSELTLTARSIKRSLIAQLVDALLSATEGW